MDTLSNEPITVFITLDRDFRYVEHFGFIERMAIFKLQDEISLDEDSKFQ